MESLIARVKEFLGSGDGSGYGDGDGDGDGSGDGSGYGYGLKSFNGNAVYLIDGVETIIRNVRGNVARGEIVNNDLTTTPCYIAKQDRHFAHGETLRDALSALREKLFDDMSEEERIAAFMAEHRPGVQYPCRDLYDWHHRLTGSCEMGRAQFARNHGIDVERDSMTVDQFIYLTKNAYGKEVIIMLEDAWKKRRMEK